MDFLPDSSIKTGLTSRPVSPREADLASLLVSLTHGQPLCLSISSFSGSQSQPSWYIVSGDQSSEGCMVSLSDSASIKSVTSF